MAMLTSSAIQIVEAANQTARKGRYPIHTHAVEYRPFQIQPFMIAPVMAGETLKNAALQARVVSDPLKVGFGNLLPWWQDHYFYYVKARQLIKDEFTDMTLNGVALGITYPANAWSYHVGGNIKPKDDWERPELIRVTSNWSYPSNTVDPATGQPTGAATFSVSEQANKDRFFMEPGFIVGVTVTKPKIFMGNQKSAATIMLDDPYVWMPRTLVDQPHITVKEFVGGTTNPTGPLRGQTNGYWVDARDLFKYGDQFLNTAALAGYAPLLPSAAGEKRFMDGAMIDALFQDAAKNKIRQDGVTRLSILGHPTTAIDNT